MKEGDRVLGQYGVEPDVGGLIFMLDVRNLVPEDVLDAQIRLGSPASPGPAIFDLDASSFEDSAGTGVFRDILEGAFPLEYVSDLRNEHTFIEISTAQGTVAGSLTLIASDVPALSEAGWVVLLLSLALAGTLLARQRAHPTTPSQVVVPGA